MRNRLINRNWYGDMTVKNMPEIVDTIRSMLTNTTYVFVSTIDGKHLTVRPNQRLEPEKSRNSDPFSIWYEEGVDRPTYGGFHVNDTYGVWGAMTSEKEKPYIVFSHNQIQIEHKNGYGEPIVWIIAIQEGRDDEE